MLNKIQDYILNNLITTIWSILLSIGGIVMIFYYTSIEYLPLFDIQSFLIVVVSIAFLFLTITSSIIFLNIVPSLSWYELFLKESKVNRILEKNNDISLKKIFIWYSLPSSILTSLILISILNNFFIKYLFLLPLLLYFLYISYCYKHINKLNLDFKNFFSELLKLQIANIVSSFTLIFPIYLIFLLALTNNKSEELTNTIFTIILIGIIIFFNTVNITLSKKINAKSRIIISLTLGFSFLFFLLITFNKTTLIPLKIMEILKVGNFTPAETLFKKEGCDILRSYNITLDKDKDKDKEICSVQNIKILSRIGTESYLELNNQKISIPSDYITSWKMNKDDKN
jgi:hypothetical protein